MTDINQAIEQAKLEYITDIDWHYRFESQFLVVDFGTNENGKFTLHEFCRKHNGMWFDLIATDKQLEAMQKRFDETPARENEPEEFRELDNYDNCGVRPEHFY